MQRTQVALNAVTATTTSGKFWVGDAKKVAVRLKRADHASGASAFTIKGSLDGPATTTPIMTALNVWIDNVTNTNAQTLTRVNGKTLNADGEAFLFLDENTHLNWIEITVTETTDGTHTAEIIEEI